MRVWACLLIFIGFSAVAFAENVEFFPIQDETNVDRLRAEMGMPSLAEYKTRIEQTYLPQECSKK